MKELYPKIIATTLLVSLGVTACSSEKPPSSKKTAAVSQPAKPKYYAPQIGVKYFSNGAREVYVSDVNNSQIAPKYVDYYQDILQWCENGDLLEETATYYEGNGPFTSSIDRTPDFKPCIDGKLTPSDFSNNPSETS